MIAEKPRCTCWRLPTESGDVAPLTWVCLHNAVRLVCKDGMSVEGWSLGADWWGPDEAPELLMDVEAADGGGLIVSLDQIATVTPVGGYTERRIFLEAVTRAIDAGFPEPDDGYLRWIVNDHETVEVEIRRDRHGCSPGPRPEWAARAPVDPDGE